MTRCTWLKPCLWAAIVALLVCGLPAWAQGQAAAPSAPAAAPRLHRLQWTHLSTSVDLPPTIRPRAIPAAPRPEPRMMWFTPTPPSRSL